MSTTPHEQMLNALAGVQDSAFFRALADLQRRDQGDVAMSERLELFLSVFEDAEPGQTPDPSMQRVRDAVPTESLQRLFALFDRARWACADELFFRGVEPAAEPIGFRL